ncbi:MAG: archaeal proteasome endopeptidase complex subunit beta [Candidatus Micrarchaeota archaeon]|nr:archaeal proteasome endopeptidase complex subunit beta [Candidatus Micrarchaeota archaeon]
MATKSKKEMEDKVLSTGTTTVGLVCSDGVIFASDKRATMGYFIANKDIQKIYQIDDHISMTIAGGVGDAQALIRLMQAEASLYKFKHGKPMSVRAAAMLLSNLLHNYKFYPFFVQLLVGGISNEKPEVFSLDALGGMTEEKFVSTGSGSPVAYGLLEEMYKEGGTVKDNLRVAARAVAAAMKRDAATGENVDVVTITKGGFKRLERSEIEKLIQ